MIQGRLYPSSSDYEGECAAGFGYHYWTDFIKTRKPILEISVIDIALLVDDCEKGWLSSFTKAPFFCFLILSASNFV